MPLFLQTLNHLFVLSAHPCPHRQPTLTGTSVLAIKCIDGIVMATDTLTSWGSLARFRSIQRVTKVNNDTICGGSGDYADFQQICQTLDELSEHEHSRDDDKLRTPKEIHQYLTRVMYERRNKFDPLWNALIVGGWRSKYEAPFLGYVDLIGTNYESDSIATGYGAYIAQPILRKFIDERGGVTYTVKEAREVLIDAMRVLVYRDARTSDKIQISTVDRDGVTIEEPMIIETKWLYKGFDIKNDK